MSKLSRITHFNLFVIFLGFTVYYVTHYSPDWLVAWGHEIDSPIWGTIFENKEYFDFFGIFIIPAYFPILASLFCVFLALKFNEPKLKLKKLHDNENGATLMEVMTVVGIIGIMSTIAIPYISKAPYKQRAASRMLYSTSQNARVSAVKTHSDISFGINDNSNVIDVYNDKGFVKSIVLPYGATISSKDVPSGSLDVKGRPSELPVSVMWACNKLGYGLWAGPIDDCPDVIKYYAPYDGTKYDHVTTWSSLGYIKTGSGNYQIKLQNTYQNVEIGVAGSMNIGPEKSI